MHVVVTGAAGFIGSHVCRDFLKNGHTVVGLDSLNSTLYGRAVKLENITDLVLYDHFTFVETDLAKESCESIIREAEVVVHEAAMPGLTKSWSDFGAYNDANLVATQRLLDAITKQPSIHLVHASTSSVYGRFAVGDERLPLNPYSPYGVTKLAAENLIGAYRENFGIKATILRYFSVYGPRQRPDMAYAKFCRQMLLGEEITVTGNGQQSRTNTYIDDIVGATSLACSARLDGLVVNISGTERIQLLEALTTLSDHLQVTPNIRFIPAALGDQLETEGDSSLAYAELGWAPRTSIRAGLERQALSMLSDQPIED